MPVRMLRAPCTWSAARINGSSMPPMKMSSSNRRSPPPCPASPSPGIGISSGSCHSSRSRRLTGSGAWNFVLPFIERLVGQFRRGEVVEGCAGGAEGRSKRPICLRATWMGDRGGKSGRRPERHLQVAASGLGDVVSCAPRAAGGFGAVLGCLCAARGAPHTKPHLLRGADPAARPETRSGRQAAAARRFLKQPRWC